MNQKDRIAQKQQAKKKKLEVKEEKKMSKTIEKKTTPIKVAKYVEISVIHPVD